MELMAFLLLVVVLMFQQLTISYIAYYPTEKHISLYLINSWNVFGYLLPIWGLTITYYDPAFPITFLICLNVIGFSIIGGSKGLKQILNLLTRVP